MDRLTSSWLPDCREIISSSAWAVSRNASRYSATCSPVPSAV